MSLPSIRNRREAWLIGLLFIVLWALAVVPTSWLTAVALAGPITAGLLWYFERRQLTELKAAEQRYRALFEANPMPAWICSLDDYRFLAVNDAACNQYGYSRPEFLTMSARDIRPAEEWDSAREALKSDDFVQGSVRRHRRKDGRLMQMECTSHRLNWQGHPARLVTANDVTERLQEQERLRQSEERYQRLLEENLAGVFSAGADGVIQDANPAMARIAGCPNREALVGTAIAALVRDFPALGAELLASGSVNNRELTIVRSDGREVPVLANVSISLLAEEGAPSHRVLGTVFDVAEYKNLERQLFQSRKMETVGQLAGGIAHDFNNLLTVINGYCELMLEAELGDPHHHRIELIHTAGTRAATLTSQLLAYGRKQVFELKVLDLNALLRDSAKLLDRALGENYRLNLGLDPELASVEADRGQIEQVFVNLVLNARDAMPRGGIITVETENMMLAGAALHPRHEVPPGRYAMFAVSDTGCGMDAATLGHLFEPFFTTKEVGTGTGLGLATAFGIVKQSGGTILAYSEVGKGTSMKVFLPAASHAAGENPEESVAGAAEGAETILLVEDDGAVRGFVVDVLRDAGYEVIEAAGPEAALELSGRHPEQIDLLVTDVVMPNMDGPTLAGHLTAARPGLRVLYVSGYPKQAIVAGGTLAPGVAFLQKPYTPQGIVAKIRELLNAAAPAGNSLASRP